MNYSELITSTSQQHSLMEAQAKAYTQKWDKSGLLQGLDDTQKMHMSVLLENQAHQLLREATNMTNQGGAYFTPGTGEQWAGLALPMVRKIFADTIAAKEFVSVQPLQVPAGLVFYLDFKYATAKAPFNVGDSVYGVTNLKNVDANGGLYGAGRHGYSLNTYSASVSATVASASFYDVDFYQPLSGSIANQQVKKVSVALSGLPNHNPTAIRGFVVTGSGDITPARTLQAYTEIDAAGTNLVFYVSGSSANVQAGTVTVQYSVIGKDNWRGDFEDRGQGLTIPQFKIDFKSEMIGTKTRKLMAEYTTEFLQDVKAYQNIDAEAELTGLISDYVAMEIDLDILDMLTVNANTEEYWSAQNNFQIAANGQQFGLMASGFYNSQGQWFQTLGTKLNKVSNKIHQKTLRGGANFMVVSPDVSTILESIPGFAADGETGSYKEYAMGVQRVGSFNSKYKVYKNPYYIENVILMGYKGSQYLETGAVYAPYIPLIMSPVVTDPNTLFTMRKGLLTRYGQKIIRPEFYGRVIIEGLHTV